MKYDLRSIMKNAWNIRKTTGKTMSESLKLSWAQAKDTERTIMVKEWVLDREQAAASRYNMFIDFMRDANGMRLVSNGYVTLFVDEKLAETAKAIRVRVSTGSVVGSAKGWTLWIPKSQIAA